MGLITESLQSKISDFLGLLGTSSLGVIIKFLLVSLKAFSFQKVLPVTPFQEACCSLHLKPPMRCNGRNSNAAFTTIFEIVSFFSSKQKLYISCSISQGKL